MGGYLPRVCREGIYLGWAGRAYTRVVYLSPRLYTRWYTSLLGYTQRYTHREAWWGTQPEVHTQGGMVGIYLTYKPQEKGRLERPRRTL